MKAQTPPSELITVGDWVRFAASSFQAAKIYYGHGTDNAWDDATQLVLHSLHLSAEWPPLLFNARLTQAECQLLHERILRRIHERIPTAYLTHHAIFAGLEFYVDERVLIPRSPFAEFIEQQFSSWINPDDVRYIADIGTGSGCIAIACAVAFPEAQVYAFDNAPEALEVARQNVQTHQLESQVTLVESDLLEKSPCPTFDLIISNPPYVDAETMRALPKEYLHEPQKALASGTDGLDCVRRLLQAAAKHLSPEGLLLVEVGGSQKALEKAYPKVPFTWLDFSRGGDGVFLLTAEQVRAHFSA